MLTILVIEDDAPYRSAVVRALKQDGYKLLEADNGEFGLELARRHRPDLVLCDVELPGIRGTDILQKLRQDPDTASIPFIIMTGYPERTSARQGMNAGADDYLSKPFSLPDLLAAVKGRLARQGQITGQYEEPQAPAKAAPDPYKPLPPRTPQPARATPPAAPSAPALTGPSFRQAVCKLYQCADADFAQRALARSLPLHARLLVPLIQWRFPNLLEEDLQMIEAMGYAQNLDQVRTELGAFRTYAANHPFLRCQLRLRASGKKILDLAIQAGLPE